jgi:hypothetical protein
MVDGGLWTKGKVEKNEPFTREFDSVMKPK